MYSNDERIVITLDAEGANFVFCAMQGNRYILDPITMASRADCLDDCLATLVEGFCQIIDRLEESPVAISFALPKPAEQTNDIIGEYLPNIPSFGDGVDLGSFLEEKFGMPIFINNDGEAMDAYAFALSQLDKK